MKKHFLSFILLGGLLSGSFHVEAKRRSAKEVVIYEKDVWAKGLPAARKKLWYKQPLTKQEQMYFDSLEKRVKAGVGAYLTLGAILIGVYGVKRALAPEYGRFPEIPEAFGVSEFEIPKKEPKLDEKMRQCLEQLQRVEQLDEKIRQDLETMQQEQQQQEQLLENIRRQQEEQKLEEQLRQSEAEVE